MRKYAGRDAASSSAASTISAAGTPQTVSAASGVHCRAAARNSSYALRVLLEERAVDEARAIEVRGHRQREHDIGAGHRREVAIGPARHRGATGIDDDHARAGAPGLVDERREVDVRDRRVRAPHDDRAARARRRAGRPRACRRTSRPTPCRASPRRSCGRRTDAPNRLKNRSTTQALHRGRRRVVDVGHHRLGAEARLGVAQRSATRSSASSHDAARNSPAPFGPVRTNGVSTRSGA